jgi:hypothetical protein
MRVDRAVCLLLDKRMAAGEAERIACEFRPHGISINFFLAGDGKTAPEGAYDYIDRTPPPGRTGYPAWANRPNSWNAFQCFRRIVHGAKIFGDDTLLVCEDDVTLAPDFREKAEAAFARMEEIDPEWETFYLGAHHTFMPTDEVAPNLLRLHGSGGWHCVLLHRRAFVPVLALPDISPIDEQCGQKIHPRGHSYACWPSVAFQKAGYSHCEGAAVDYSHHYLSKGSNHR